jgi:hypothetical protein
MREAQRIDGMMPTDFSRLSKDFEPTPVQKYTEETHLDADKAPCSMNQAT